MAGALAVLSMGLVLGLQHATDADHVVAVSTIVARERRVDGAARIGFFWGLGHSATVLLAGGAMVASGLVLHVRAAQALELGVAVMLVVLGVAGVRRAWRARSGTADPGGSSRSHGLAAPAWRRPAAIGVVHGLAGSAALALAVLATVTDRATSLGYLGTFCVGTILGMSLVTAALAAPVAAASRWAGPIVLTRVATLAGVLSVSLGVWLGYRVGIVEGLLRAALP